ncbi:acyl-CoA thioesterase [Streptomyces sp. F63]|uniref:acyl-CoA thioesterase n=1 Tax=Streptomyces sp. F63 TaxID=2824887 RepID=UPI001B35AD5E|nr:thioesterase family protein [Streptomyces sp. F63]MBQ0987272.1 acyl-CoA thioesterase [Streptomyces sp. F63]
MTGGSGGAPAHGGDAGAGTGSAATGVPGSFRTTTEVAWDELDALGVLHHARFPVHAERAFSRLLDTMGYPYDPDPAVHPERHHVVARLDITFTGPVDRPGTLHIEQRVTALGRTSLTTGFTVMAADGDGAAAGAVAEGARTAVHIDRATRRPRPWSEEFRARLRAALAGPPAARDGGRKETTPWT